MSAEQADATRSPCAGSDATAGEPSVAAHGGGEGVPAARVPLPAAPRGGGEREQVRFAVVGVSDGEICGVRDYAMLLTDGLRARGASSTTHWLVRRATTLREEREEFRGWFAEVLRALEETRPDAIILHYSVFGFSHRGVPIHVPALRALLKRAQAPVIVVAHELVFPFGRHGWRGLIWAASQRAVLFGLVRVSAAFLLTTESRARWLPTRRLLPKRTAAFAPVFSNLPPPRARTHDASREARAVGLFGYGYQGDRVSVVIDALARLAAWRPSVRLVLLGAPGPDSQAGGQWLALARARGVDDALRFSGTMHPQELSDAIADCDVLLFVDAPGPTSRKGSLASGRPVVATDGHQRWQQLVDSGAVRIADPTAASLAAEVRALLEDASERDALGVRGRGFHDEQMAVAVAADAVLRLYERIRSSAGASMSSA
jgi:glycosyltransferase involved in cell wall biosynthesis